MSNFTWYHRGIRAYWESLAHRGRANFIWRETIAKRTLPLSIFIAILQLGRAQRSGVAIDFEILLLVFALAMALAIGAGYWWASRVWKRFAGEH